MIYSSRNDRTIQELSSQSDGWAKRLETLEKEMMISTDSSNDPAVNRMSIRVIDTADSARSTRDSILSLYGHRSYYQKILDPREAPFAMALELQADYVRVSRIIEDHLEDDHQPEETASNAVDEVLDVHANPSTKPAEILGPAELSDSLHRYPGSAKALRPYFAPPSQPRSWLETGIAPKSYFYPIENPLEKPLPPLPSPPNGSLSFLELDI